MLRLLSSVALIGVAMFLIAFGAPLFDLFYKDYDKGVSLPFTSCESIYSDAIGSEDAAIVSHEPEIVLLSSAPRISVTEALVKNGAIYVFKGEDRSVSLVPLIGYDSDIFHPHGISIVSEGDDTFLYVVNHQHKGMPDQIVLFEYINEELHYKETYEDEKFVSVNDVAGLTANSFYVTNDNGYPRNERMNIISLIFPFLTKSSVVYFDGSASHFVVPPGAIAFANGVAISTTDNRLYVSSSSPGSLEIYEYSPEQPEILLHIKSLFLGTGIDNLTLDDKSGAIYAGCHPNPIMFLQHVIKKGESLAPSQALRILPQDLENIIVEEIFLSTGKEVSASSTALLVGKHLMITPVLQNYFAFCE